MEVIDNLAQPVSNGPTPPSSKPPHPAGAPERAPVPQPSTGPGAGAGPTGPTPSQPLIKPKVQQPDDNQMLMAE